MSRAKRVVLHVGTMKSGTSYLQSILRRNSTSFASNGVMIPERMVAAAADALGNKGKNRVMDIRGEWQRVLSQIDAWEGDQVIASHEFFGAASQAQAVAVVESLRPHEVEIVVSARDLLRVIPSHWQTTVKSARTIAFADYVQLLLGERPFNGPEEERLLTGFWQHHDVSRVAQTWATAAGSGSVTLVTVPPSGAEPVLLWERFAAACHVESASYDVAPDSQSNASLSFSETEMLRQVNQALAGKMSPRQYRAYVNNQFANGILRDLGGDDDDVDKPRLNSEQRRLVSERASDMIESLDAGGVRIIGDLADLRVDPPTGDGNEEAPAPLHEVPEFAITVISRLLLDRVDSTEGGPRRRQPGAGAAGGARAKGRSRPAGDGE